MAKKYILDELNKCSKQDLMLLVLSMQEQLDCMNGNIENLVEQIRIANQQRFGRHSERLDIINGQLNLFNKAEVLSEEQLQESAIDDVLPPKLGKRKQSGKRNADLSGFPEEKIIHSVSEDKLRETYGEGNYKRMPDETYKRRRYEPATWTVEVHTVQVYVGTDGLNQDG